MPKPGEPVVHGALVTEVVVGGVASTKGVSVGDILVEVDGAGGDYDDLLRAAANAKRPVEFTFQHHSSSAPLPVGPCLLPELLPDAPPALLAGGGVLGELDSCGLGGLLALGHPDRNRHRHAAPVA